MKEKSKDNLVRSGSTWPIVEDTDFNPSRCRVMYENTWCTYIHARNISSIHLTIAWEITVTRMESEGAWEVTKALSAKIWDDHLWKGVLSSIEGLGGSCACSCIAFIAAWIRWRTTSNRLVREINISRRFDLLSESGLQLSFDSRIAIFIRWRTISILAFRRVENWYSM